MLSLRAYSPAVRAPTEFVRQDVGLKPDLQTKPPEYAASCVGAEPSRRRIARGAGSYERLFIFHSGWSVARSVIHGKKALFRIPAFAGMTKGPVSAPGS